MADEEEHTRVADEFAHLPFTLGAEILVTHREGFVDDKNVVLLGCRYRKLQSLNHSGRISGHREVDKVTDPRELNDFVKFVMDFFGRVPHRQATEDDVLATRKRSHHRGANAQQARVRSSINGALDDGGNLREGVHEGRFARSV